MTATDPYYDPYDYAIDADPYPIWKRLRDEAPVYRNDEHGFYALSRYDDVLKGLLDSETFLSSHGIVLEMIADEPYENLPMMIMMDPPAHTRLRKLVSRAFTPRRIAGLERTVAALCDEFFAAIEGEAEFDYIDRFAGVLPPTVILSLVGFPEGHAEEFRRQTDQSLHIEEGATSAALGCDAATANKIVELTRPSSTSRFASGTGPPRRRCGERAAPPPWRSSRRSTPPGSRWPSPSARCESAARPERDRSVERRGRARRSPPMRRSHPVSKLVLFP
jgi:cytochrome P450